MPRAHLRYFFFTLAVAAALSVARSQGQDAGAPRAFLPASILPAIDRGVVADMSHSPGSPEAVVRESMRHSAVALDRTGASGTRYVAGRVIVKFRAGVSSASRVRAMSAVSQTASVSERPSYANFDIVRIDPAEDAEAVAAALRRQPDVEYAQPAYRVRHTLVPNDQFYKELQWNLPLIDLERAWDIQPAAGSEHHRRRARHRRGVHEHHHPGSRANAFRDDERHALPGAWRPDAELRGRSRAGPRQPIRVAARFHLGRQRAAGFRRPRHARQRHGRTSAPTTARAWPAWPST